LQINRKEFQSI